MATAPNSIRLFRFSGIDVFLHWSWFVFAIFEIDNGIGQYSAPAWKVVEYLGLFLIVLIHEFGHALACRQVGGAANRIVLWPLGGVAYVSPPPRAGATLWSIAAGPLVNVVLIPVLMGIGYLGRASGGLPPDVHALLRAIWIINWGLLLFNILPIYPLDGGQILRSLLWFLFGRARSLMIATAFGFLGIAAFFVLAIAAKSVWLGALGAFMLLNCWGGLQNARVLARMAKSPRRDGFACPACKAAPPLGEYWRCSKCKQPFDTFVTQAVCPFCSTPYPTTRCAECGAAFPIAQWTTASAAATAGANSG